MAKIIALRKKAKLKTSEEIRQEVLLDHIMDNKKEIDELRSTVMKLLRLLEKERKSSQVE